MKKYKGVAPLLASILMTTFSAQAAEVGVNLSRDTANNDRTGYGFTVGQKFDKVGVSAGFDRFKTGTDVDKYSLVGSYDVATVGTATIAVKTGVAYLHQKDSTDGFAALMGAGVSMPIAKGIAATVDYRYQAGQTRVSTLDGSTVSAGIKYSF
jgi:opacity protein-like surface antigen